MTDSNRQRTNQAQHAGQVIAKALRMRDETRQKLLKQGRKLARRRADNVQRSRTAGEDTRSSTVVSSHSTVPPIDSNEVATARHSHSTVPARPKGSTVPAAERLYGLALYEQIRPRTRRKAERSGGDDESEQPAADASADTAGTDGGHER